MSLVKAFYDWNQQLTDNQQTALKLGFDPLAYDLLLGSLELSSAVQHFQGV